MEPRAERGMLLVSTGCSSSDILLAPVLAELRERRTFARVVGIGGEPIREEGAELLFDSTPLATIGTAHGFTMVLKAGWTLWKVFRSVKKLFRTDPPDMVVLVDNAGINCRILALAHQHHVPVVYYVPPEMWSVLRIELGTMRNSQPHIAAIFQSQAEEYQKLGLHARWVGHPILDLIPPPAVDKREVAAQPVFGFFPGSRQQEVAILLQPMRHAAHLIAAREPSARFVICAANPLAREMIEADFPRWPSGTELRYRDSHSVLTESDVVLACSGTITLEAALIETPLVAMYRLRGFVDRLLRYLLLPAKKFPYFSLPNVILQRAAIPELAGSAANPRRIADEAISLLRDSTRRSEVVHQLRQIRPRLGNPGGVKRVADMIEEVLRDAVGRHNAASRSAA